MSQMFSTGGGLTSEARGHLFTAAQRIRRGNLRAAIRAAPEHLDQCLVIAEFMVQAAGLHPSAVGVGALSGPAEQTTVRLELRHMGEEK